MAVVARQGKKGTSYFAIYKAGRKQHGERVGWLPPDATRTDHKHMRDKAQALYLQRQEERLAGILILPREREAQRKQREQEERPPMTFAEMAEAWLQSESGGKGRPFHAQRVKQWTGSHGDHFKDKPVDDVTPADLRRFVELRRELDGAGASTLRKELVGLASLYHWGRDWEYTTGDPANTRRVPRPKEPRPSGAAISQADEDRLCAALPGHVRRLVRFLLVSGMDRGDALALTWADVNTRTKLISKPRNKSGVPFTVPILTREEAAKLLDVSVDSLDARPCLGELVADLRRECPVGTSWVFLDPSGQPMNMEALKSAMRRARAKIGLTVSKPWKVLRHSFGSRLAEAGVDQASAAEFMGHAALHMTQRYQHPSRPHLRGQMAKLLAWSEAGVSEKGDKSADAPDQAAEKSA